MLFVSRRRYRRDIADLRDRLDRMREHAEAAARVAETEYADRQTITRQYAEADAANWRLECRNRSLQKRLDQACGIDGPAVTAGERWQESRQDKREETKS